MLKTGGLCSKQEKVFRGCILSALTSHLSNKHTPWRALWRRCKRFDPSCRLVESTFTWKSQTNISFGFRIRELLYTNWPQKMCFNQSQRLRQTIIGCMPIPTSILSLKKCAFLPSVWRCSDSQSVRLRYKSDRWISLFVDFSNPPLGSKRCPRMSIFFVYKDQNIYKNYCITLSYHL